MNGNKTTFPILKKDWQQLAQYCQDHFPSQARIGVLMSSKLLSLKSIGAIILANQVYVPLDAQAPSKRTISIIEQNQLHGMLVDKAVYTSVKNDLPAHQLIPLESINIIQFESVRAIQSPPNLAFILNTSGSTGTPKGVMISPKNVQNFIEWANQILDINSEDIITSIAPFHFDLSVFDIYTSLRQGTRLILFEAEQAKNPRLIAQQLAQHKVSIIYATPTLLSLLLYHGKLERYDFSALRYVLFAGEVFPIEDLKKLKQIWQQAEFYNWYGPTETNVCTYHKLPDLFDEQTTPFPIGKACIPNTTKVAADGELLVSGEGVTMGYINPEKHNQEVFSTDENGIRWYHTGDLVHIEENGDYVFLGRKDRMVKRNGYRIELDEIEHYLHQHPDIQNAAVVADKDENNNTSIICFYVPKSSDEKLDLRAYLNKYLPLYMLTNQFVRLGQLPQTSSQKTDYQSLKNTFS